MEKLEKSAWKKGRKLQHVVFEVPKANCDLDNNSLTGEKEYLVVLGTKLENDLYIILSIFILLMGMPL